MTEHRWEQCAEPGDSALFHGVSTCRVEIDELMIEGHGPKGIRVSVIQHDSLVPGSEPAHISHVLDRDGVRQLRDALSTWMDAGPKCVNPVEFACRNACKRLEVLCKTLPGPVVNELQPVISDLRRSLR